MSRKDRALDIEEDLAFQKREWLVQRVGVALLLGFVAAAALGMTGMGGPVSHGEAGERGAPVHVEFDRFVRRGAMATVTLRQHAPFASAASDRSARLRPSTSSCC
jgi:hypothetical protein